MPSVTETPGGTLQLQGVTRALRGGIEASSSGSGEKMLEMSDEDGSQAEDEENDDDERDEDSDEETLEDTPSLPVVDNPSKDIKGDLSKVFAQKLEFHGSYHFSKECPDAPNPCLQIQDLGPVGLPLSERDAKHIITHSTHAPFGKGERTLVDPSVRDTWEIDGGKVVIDNPKWQSFMTTIVEELCRTLGVHYQKSRPRYELYKLLLYETGSHFLAHKDTEKTPGMFATIIVVLPSKFSGGALHLSHGGLSTVVDFSKDSGVSTSVASWYTDVTHEVKPVTSGYRLALSYNLIHTTNTLRPSLSSSLEGLQQLRHILLSWQQNLGTAPPKIMYLLDHTYAKVSLKGSALKGKDAHIVAMLNTLAQECHFELGLASIECHISGTADDWGQYERSYPRRRKFRCAYDDGYDDEDSDESMGQETPGMGEVDERTMSITGLVDLDGNQLLDEVAQEEEHDEECIPVGLRKHVEAGAPDEQEYEGYQGNYAGQMEQWYRRTVLVIWPWKRTDDLLENAPLEDRMIDVLTSVRPNKPRSPKQKEALDFVLKIQPQSGFYWSVTGGVCYAAAQWQDRALWTRGFDEFQGQVSLDKLGAILYAVSMKMLGVEFVLPFLQKTLKADPSDSKRLAFMDDITKQLTDMGMPELLEWIPAAIDLVLHSLKPLEAANGPMILQLAAKNGGMTFLRDTIVPQFKANTGPTRLLTLVRALRAEVPHDGGLITTDADLAVRNAVIRDILIWGIPKVDLFQKVSKKALYGGTTISMTPDYAKLFLVECCSTGNDDLVKGLVDKLVLPVGDPLENRRRMEEVLAPLLPQVAGVLKGRPKEAPPVPGIARLYEKALPMSIERVPYGLRHDDVGSLVTAVVFGGVNVLKTIIVPALMRSTRIDNTHLHFIRELYSRRAEIVPSGSPATEAFETIVKDLFEWVLKASPSANVGDLLDICVELNQRASFQAVLSKSSTPPGSPFAKLSEIHAFLDKNNLPRNAPPFAVFYKKTIVEWCRTSLGVPPGDVKALLEGVRRMSCQCPNCSKLASFFRSNQPSISFERIGAPAAKHLNQILSAAPRASDVATWQITKHRSPQGFAVSKKPSITQAASYGTRQMEGANAVKSISSSETILCEIFGGDYAALCRLLGVRFFHHQLLLAPQSNAAASSSGSAVPHGSNSGFAVPRPKNSVPNAPRTTDNGALDSSKQAQGPASKRRKVDVKNVPVVDLTTP